MKSRSKSNNFIAVLIAIVLFAIGFALYFIHQQSKSNEPAPPVKASTSTMVITGDLLADDNTFRFVSLTRLT